MKIHSRDIISLSENERANIPFQCKQEAAKTLPEKSKENNKSIELRRTEKAVRNFSRGIIFTKKRNKKSHCTVPLKERLVKGGKANKRRKKCEKSGEQ